MPYAWIITEDHLADDGDNAAGTAGPRDVAIEYRDASGRWGVL